MRKKKQGFHVQAYGSVVLENNETWGSPIIAAHIKKSLRRRGFKGSKCSAMINGDETIYRNIRVPRTSYKKLQKLMKYEVEKHITETQPMVCKFVHLRNVPKTEMEVLITAINKEIIKNCMTTMLDAGLYPVVIDVESLTLLRLWKFSEQRDKSISLILYPGDNNSTLILTKNSEYLFSRNIPVGYDMLDALVSEINHSIEYYQNETGESIEISSLCLLGHEAVKDQLAVALRLPVRTTRDIVENLPNGNFIFAAGLALREWSK